MFKIHSLNLSVLLNFKLCHILWTVLFYIGDVSNSPDVSASGPSVHSNVSQTNCFYDDNAMTPSQEDMFETEPADADTTIIDLRCEG